jgi:hypothetical protein
VLFITTSQGWCCTDAGKATTLPQATAFKSTLHAHAPGSSIGPPPPTLCTEIQAQAQAERGVGGPWLRSQDSGVRSQDIAEDNWQATPHRAHTHWQLTKAHRAQCSGLQGTCPLAGSRWARKFLPSSEEVMPTNGPASATEACWEATTAVRATANDLAKTMSGGGDRGDTHAHT